LLDLESNASLVYATLSSLSHPLGKQTNLADPAVRQAGIQRKNAVNPTSVEGGVGVVEDQPKYRDRAAERRIAFNQPDKPVLDPTSTGLGGWKRKLAEGPKASVPGPPPPPPRPAPGLEPGKDESNVGNQLLAKMGWRSGEGLGRESEGRVEPVLVQQFENRAGLGASKGVEAGRWAGEGGFKRRALDMVSASGDVVGEAYDVGGTEISRFGWREWVGRSRREIICSLGLCICA
jgi:RNA-binding protein 5/10